MKVGIIGCGQLARMMALAGWPMGLSFSFLAEGDEDDACVQGLGKIVRRHASVSGSAETVSTESGAAGGGDVSAEDLYRALGSPAVITVEKEQVDVQLLRELQGFCPVYPDPDVIAICQHRGREKAFLNNLGIPTAPYRLINASTELEQAVQALGTPVFVKSCEHGYDGQNQWRIRNAREAESFMSEQTQIPECVVEGQVRFAKEVSVIVVRGANKQTAVYPVTENYHRHGTLLTSVSPVDDLSESVRAQVDEVVGKLLKGWDYVGVLAIECFVTDEGLLVNELAPRVHNSGHWTQQSAATSQFENHLRAVTGLTLGETKSNGYGGMVNLLGQLAPTEIAIQANSHLHLYNKAPKPKRKLGHINLQHESDTALRQQIETMVQAIYGLSATESN